MPTYDYVCDACGHEFEAFQRMSENVLTDCPSCEDVGLRRKIGRGAGFIFKGGGFYETDFKDKKGKKEEAPSSSSSESPSSSSDSAKASGDAAASAKPAEKPAAASTPAS